MTEIHLSGDSGMSPPPGWMRAGSVEMTPLTIKDLSVHCTQAGLVIGSVVILPLIILVRSVHVTQDKSIQLQDRRKRKGQSR